MFRDKAELAGLFRSLARRIAEMTPEEAARQLLVLSNRLEKEHEIDMARERIANEGTAECPTCNGSRTLFMGTGYAQCSLCKGWGRVENGEPR